VVHQHHRDLLVVGSSRKAAGGHVRIGKHASASGTTAVRSPAPRSRWPPRSHLALAPSCVSAASSMTASLPPDGQPCSGKARAPSARRSSRPRSAHCAPRPRGSPAS
jgi:hypothetical protein